MLDCRGLPAAPEDLAGVVLDLPVARSDRPGGDEITGLLKYLRLEAPGGAALALDQLAFGGSVDFGQAEYWVWAFNEPEGGQRAYAYIRHDRGGKVSLGYDTDYYDLSPVQFAVGDYCGYW